MYNNFEIGPIRIGAGADADGADFKVIVHGLASKNVKVDQ